MIGDTRLEIIHTDRDLGVVLNRRLTFCKHIDFIVSRANKVNGIVMRSMQSWIQYWHIELEINFDRLLWKCSCVIRILLRHMGGAAKSQIE